MTGGNLKNNEWRVNFWAFLPRTPIGLTERLPLTCLSFRSGLLIPRTTNKKSPNTWAYPKNIYFASSHLLSQLRIADKSPRNRSKKLRYGSEILAKIVFCNKAFKKTLTVWIYTSNIKMLLLLESPEQNAGYEEIFSLNQKVTLKKSM